MDRGDFSTNDTLDVIVRFHDLARISELARCLLSLVCQTYRPIVINLCTQRFSADEIAAIQAQMKSVLQIDESVQMRVHNFASEHPADARSALLNLGMKNSAGRYLAFLDYDDVIFPQSYQTLIGELRSSKSAIAFGSINIKHVDVHDEFVVATRRSNPFYGEGLRDLVRANFCPIHSFVIDRSMASKSEMYVDNCLSKNEDYDFILRICASSRSSFRLCRCVVGDYYLKSDGSNTIMVQYDRENREAWDFAEAFLAARKTITVVSPEVQRSLGIAAPNPKMTLSMLIEPIVGE